MPRLPALRAKRDRPRRASSPASGAWSSLKIAALTDKDLVDLDFVAAHADGIGFSFVQSADDVEMLQDALAERRQNDWHTLSLILKIETS